MYLREIRNKKDKTKMGCYNDDHERKIVRNRNVYCFENAENSENLEKKREVCRSTFPCGGSRMSDEHRLQMAWSVIRPARATSWATWT